MSHYISNGTMGDIWMSHNCFRCAEDHCASHVGDDEADWENGCQILARLMMGDDNIPELIEHDYDDKGWPLALECRMFSPCQPCDGGGEDEQPAPFDPGPDHGVLFHVINETATTPMVIIPALDDQLAEVATGGLL